METMCPLCKNNHTLSQCKLWKVPTPRDINEYVPIVNNLQEKIVERNE